MTVARMSRSIFPWRTASLANVGIVVLLAFWVVALRAEEPALVQFGKSTLLEGRLVDVQGRTLGNAKVSAIYETTIDLRKTAVVTADNLGQFRLAPENEKVLPFLVGGIATLDIVTDQGQHYEANVVIERREVVVHVPTRIGAKIAKVEEVGVGELAGTVIGHEGAPLAGVTVDVGYAHRGHETETDANGQFRLKGFDRDEKVEVIFRKPSYSPETFMQQPTGVAGWVVALGSETYVEGTVITPNRKPAAGVLVRANQGPKLGSGFRRSELWTETTTDENGHYRLYLQPDAYEITAEAPGIGIARFPKSPVRYGEAQQLEIPLKEGIVLRIKCIDADTREPVFGVRLHHWQKKTLNAISDADGTIVLTGLLPGRFEFDVDAKGYGRWWTEHAKSPWNRKSIDKPELNWQRNFDYLDFDLLPEMPAVTILLEKAACIRGRVVDPDGNPVAGATAAPALTGTGNSLTGDTRFSVLTGADGTFEMWLPASNKAQYNLVAHDGAYQRWRNWANGTLPPIKTAPGQQIEGVEIRLTKPATVRGKVVDENGNPVANREVRAHAADKTENRYYDPTVTTKEDGTFELRFIRPSEQYIQAAPFWLAAQQGPADSTVTAKLEAGQTLEGVVLVGHESK